MKNPRGSIYPNYGIRPQKKPSPLWFWGPNSIMVVYVGPSGTVSFLDVRSEISDWGAYPL